MSTSRRLGGRSHGKPRRGFSRVAVTAALIVGLLIGTGATYILAGAAPSRTITVTKTLPVVIDTSTTTATIRQTSTTTRAIVANASTVASNGLRLSTSINATDITVGQNLNISISLFNTLQTANALEQGGRAGSLQGNWTFYGITRHATWSEISSIDEGRK